MKAHDADSHVLEPMNMWQEYVEPRYRADAPRLITDERTIVEGEVPASPFCVLYTSVGLSFGGNEDPRLMAALCRASSNRVSDFCKQAPGHFAAVALLPLMDLETARVEARRAVEQLGLEGVMLRPNPYAGRMLHDPTDAPFWQEIQGLGMSIAFHEGATGNIPFAGADRCKKHPGVENPGYLSFAMSHLICHLHQQQILMQMIFGDVLEQFPGLKVAFMEAGSGWLPYWLHRHSPRSCPRSSGSAGSGPRATRPTWPVPSGRSARTASSELPMIRISTASSRELSTGPNGPGSSEAVLEELLWKNTVALYNL